MAYTPDPTDPTQPIETVYASTAAAEFRALKGYLQGVIDGNIGTVNAGVNLVHNPAFIVNQRNAGTINTNDGFFADRWRLINGPANRITAARDFTSPDVGFGSALIGLSSAGVPSGTDVYGIYQYFEGHDWAPLLWGTGNAKAITVSFIALAGVTGTYSFFVRNAGSTRSYVTTFNLIAGQPTAVKLLIPGDQGGPWSGSNARLGSFGFGLGSVNTFFTPTPGTWQNGNHICTSTQVQFTVGANYFKVWNMQIQQGAIQTAFAPLPFALEIARCQRYYEIGTASLFGYNTAGATVQYKLPFRQLKRIAPAVNVSTVTNSNTSGVSAASITDMDFAPFANIVATGAFGFAFAWDADAEL